MEEGDEEGGGKDRGGNKRMEMQEKQWSEENVPKKGGNCHYQGWKMRTSLGS